jgi:hypothetical protein
MKPEEITVLAGHRIVSPWVMKLAMDVAKAENEACAQICLSVASHLPKFSEGGFKCCEAIRARGEA